ncbi:SH3-like domain-containing protein [Pseudonocardia phyllosphaerae]|uniref:SH3-like domain-containing protein n=1 Tax=Pseudonocardia phyllosphaerae TaxID=3390502 RepID=UPI0039793CCA
MDPTAQRSVADLGGAPGWGPVVRPSDVEPEPPFHERWEQRAFALTLVTMGRVSGRNLDAFRLALSRLDRHAYLDDGYYGRWLAAAELMLTDSAILAPGAVEARARRLAAPDSAVPDGDLAEPPDPTPAKPDHTPSAPGSLRRLDRAPRFAAGDPVRTHPEPPAGPSKLPGYLAGRQGVITAVRPPHVLPDTNAVFAGEHPQHVYTVGFTGTDLFGPGAEATTVHADLFESYLEER